MLRRIINNENEDPRSASQAGQSSRESASASKPSYSSQRSDVESAPSTSTSRQNTSMNTTKNILSSDVEIKGSLKFSNDLVIDGTIEGEITSDGALTVGENAIVKGEIKVKSVTVFGKVEGNISVGERCELKANSELMGDVKARTLAIEEGATFLGKSIVGAAAAKAGAGSPSSSSPSSSSQPQQSAATSTMK